MQSNYLPLIRNFNSIRFEAGNLSLKERIERSQLLEGQINIEFFAEDSLMMILNLKCAIH